MRLSRLAVVAAIAAVLITSGCAVSSSSSGDDPYDTDTPAPIQHLGVDVSGIADGSTVARNEAAGSVAGYIDRDGYTYDLTLRQSYGAATKDISNSAPGRALLVLPWDVTVTVKNTTPGRNAPLKRLTGINFAAAWPKDSPLCNDVVPEFTWDLHGNGPAAGYCLVYMNFSNPPITDVTLASGESQTFTATGSGKRESTEAAVDAAIPLLAAGPAFWLATDKIEAGLVLACGGQIIWMSSAVFDCRGAAVGPAPAAAPGATSAAAASIAAVRYIESLRAADGTLNSDLPNCPLGDLSQVTLGLPVSQIGATTWVSSTVDDVLGQRPPKIYCFTPPLRLFVESRSNGGDASVVLSSSKSDEVAFAGGTFYVSCESNQTNCHPVWYSDTIVISGVGGAVTDPLGQMEWFKQSLPVMLANLAKL